MTYTRFNPTTKSELTVDTVALTIGSTAKNGNATVTKSAAKTGYTPLGIVGFDMDSGTRQNWLNIWTLNLSGSTITAKVLNFHASDSASATLTVYVLYAKG